MLYIEWTESKDMKEALENLTIIVQRSLTTSAQQRLTHLQQSLTPLQEREELKQKTIMDFPSPEVTGLTQR